MTQTKKCTECLEVLDISNFHTAYNKARGKSYYRAKCKECRKKILNKYKQTKVLSNDKTRNCVKCNITKPETEFYAVGRWCRICSTKYNSSHYHRNKAKIKNAFIICSQCSIEKHSNYFRYNRKTCKNCERAYGRNYNVENSHIRKNWLSANKEKIIKNQLKRRSMMNMSISALLALNNLDSNLLREWIEFNFDDNMDWSNHGTIWHLDHTLPLSKFTGDDLSIINNWTNLMPIKKHLNLKKSDRICPFYLFHLERKIREFGYYKKIKVEYKIKGLVHCFIKVINLSST